MKTEFKSSDKVIKDPFENILKRYKGIRLLDAMFYKYNLDVFNKLYRYTLQNKVNQHKNHSKTLKKADKFTGVNNQDSINIFSDSIDILPASRHDIRNYLARNCMANYYVQAIMRLDGRLDFDKLTRAVRLSVDVEPVLGCRLVEDNTKYWKRLDNIDEIDFCSLEETDNSEEAIKRFLQSPLDIDDGLMVKVKIIRSEQYDILGVKVNHLCCDGTDTKEYIQLLSRIYSCIDQGDAFIPEPKISGIKNQERLFEELCRAHPGLSEDSMLDTKMAKWRFPWIQRGGDSIRFSVFRLPQGSLESIYQYGKLRDATVNDLILTAFYRAMFKTSKPEYGVPMDISSSVDLRRFLPDKETQAIRNLSGGFITRIARIRKESFEDTLSRVVNTTKKIKDNRVNNKMDEENVENTFFTYFQEYFESMSQTSEISSKRTMYIGDECFPGLSNFGYISKTLISFGKNVVTDAYIIPSVIRAPGFLLLSSSYNGILTMSIGYCKASTSQRDMKGLLNDIKKELMRGCECEK